MPLKKLSFSSRNDVGIGDIIAEVPMSRFLNRILGIPIELQNKLFQHFCETLDEIIARERKAGKYDMGILGEKINLLFWLESFEMFHITIILLTMHSDLGNTENAEKIQTIRFLRQHATGTAHVVANTVGIHRGLSFEDALAKWAYVFLLLT